MDNLEKNIKVLSDCEERIRAGLGILLFRKYKKEQDDENAKFLLSAVMNELMIEKPTNEKAEEFLKENKELIDKKLYDSLKDDNIRTIIALEYAVEIMYHHGNNEDRVNKILDVASERNILIPSVQELGGDRIMDNVYSLSKIFLEKQLESIK